MSPASQGSLEVEHYIGSNLISSCARINNSRSHGKGRKPDGKAVLHRPNCAGDVYHRGGGVRGSGYPGMPGILSSCGCRTGNLNVGSRPGQHYGGAANWTGVPLISVDDGKKKGQAFGQKDRSRPPTTGDDESALRIPLSRLAIHTQGAPLILSGRCYNGNRRNQNVRSHPNRTGDLVVRRSANYKDPLTHGSVATSDCLSVTSDESSGSGHSENILPRIIKPRKRRKKDRKPSGPSASGEAFDETTGSSDAAGKSTSTGNSATCAEKGAGPAAAKCEVSKAEAKAFGPRHVNGSQRDEAFPEDEAHGPELHHTFEDVTESESAGFGCLPSSCQCHYCDPSGIWNASLDFVPVRTPAFFSPPPRSNTKSFSYFPHSDLVLRRSWSEPIPDVTTESGPKGTWQQHSQQQGQQQQAGGLPLRSHSFSDSTTRAKDWSDKTFKIRDDTGDATSRDAAPAGEKCLEVSTEIVTSPNGHRDIEIRFYSTSPAS